jgi:DNA-binding MarR family transcriptional regulator
VQRAIERGSRVAGLPVQQQAFLLALSASDDAYVPLREIRRELDINEATTSELLARLTESGLVERHASRDRRAATISLTAAGRRRLLHSIAATRREIQHADRRGELNALADSIAAYLAYYTRRNRDAGAGRAPGRTSRR